MVPQPVQAKLLAVLRDNTQATRLHTSAYSMLALPWAQRYQQSNQWAIETLAMAQSPQAAPFTRERPGLAEVQRLRAHHAASERLHPAGARATAANIAFDDHPSEKRFSDRIETVTVDSVFAWLNRSGLATPVQLVR